MIDSATAICCKTTRICWAGKAHRGRCHECAAVGDIFSLAVLLAAGSKRVGAGSYCKECKAAIMKLRRGTPKPKREKALGPPGDSAARAGVSPSRNKKQKGKLRVVFASGGRTVYGR